ncbi:3-methyl-2-oxobutanoate hydroxymethyltransferase [bacterium]|nr:MAG: 3-methyl-2-oxobutanoate hydroxymethyltransferase [bacterium]
MPKITVRNILELKESGKPIVALTAYDYFTAKYIDSAGVDIILVGDSLEMVIYGSDTTLTANMDKMLFHTEAVAKATKNAMVVGDMPFLSYQGSLGDAVLNAGRFLQAGAQAVKIEGGWKFSAVVRAIVDSGIPVMGHIGMLPQSVHRIGGYITQGEDEDSSRRLFEDASSLQEAGAFSIVLEKVDSNTAKKITQNLNIPTIGIGAGSHCDGQILVINDILGLYDKFTPPFVKQYTNLKEEIIRSAKSYAEDVRNKKFPKQEG